MKVTVNGQGRELPPGATVASLLATLGMGIDRVAVELNRAILPKSRFAEAALADGDTIEIVQFVGGG
jgi:thiamine biosynthesis protein ThiS